MLNLHAPSNSYSSLRSFYDQLESSIRSLESLGETQEKYGSLLVPIVLDKLPAEIRKHLARENGSDKWMLADLRHALHKELTVLEAGSVSQIPDVTNATAYFFTSGAKRTVPAAQRKPNDAAPGARLTLCVFCGDHHSSANCSKLISRQDRVAVVKRKRLCFNCLGQHLVSACHSNNRCRQCKRKHHTSICDQSTVTVCSGISDKETTEPQPSAAAAFHSTIQNQANVLLKTALAEVTFQSLTKTTNILFDEGVQRSFITQQIADELELPRNGRDLINLATFGSNTRKTLSFETTIVYVIADRGQSILFNVLITVLSGITEGTTADPPSSLKTREDCGIHKVINIENFSNYQKLLRVTAYAMRFIRNCRVNKRTLRETGFVTVIQLRSAEILWLRSCQSRNYHDEIVSIQSQKKGPSIVKQLGLFIDSTGLLSCNGRIHNSSLDEQAKFPYLLPPKNNLTYLIIRHAHERQLHAGTEASVTSLRQKFWIPSGRQCLPSVIQKCVTCRKIQVRPYEAPDPRHYRKFELTTNQLSLFLEWIIQEH